MKNFIERAFCLNQSVSHNAHIPFLGGIYRSACMFLCNDPMYYKKYNIVLNAIQKAGESLYLKGKIDNRISKNIHIKINPEEFQERSNKFWENVVLKEDYFVKRV